MVSSPSPTLVAGASPLRPSPLQRLFAAPSATPPSAPPSSSLTPVSDPRPSSSTSALSAIPSSSSSSFPSSSSSASPPSPVRCCVCLWCLLDGLRVSGAPAALLSHLPPHWQAQQRLTQWKRRGKCPAQHWGDAADSARTVQPCVTQPHRPQWRLSQAHGSSAAAPTTTTTTQPSATTPAGRLQPSPPLRAAQQGSAVGASGAESEVRCVLDRVSRLHGFLSHRDIPQLIRQTNYTRHELFAIFLRFKSLCCLSPDSGPEGIDASTFRRGVVPLSVEDLSFVSRVFALVDTDNSNSIEWDEFLCAVTALEKGSAEVKAKFACQVYDLDGDGHIGRADLTAMFTASSMLKAGDTGGVCEDEVDDSLSDAVIAMFVSKVFDTLGCAESGVIAFDDVLSHIKQTPANHDVWDLLGRSMLTDTTNAPHTHAHTHTASQSQLDHPTRQRRHSHLTHASSRASALLSAHARGP